MSHKIKTTWNDIEHLSREIAAYANFVTPSAMRYRINQGYTSDADMLQNSSYTSVIYKEVVYRSLYHCAKVNRQTNYMMRKLIALDKASE